MKEKGEVVAVLADTGMTNEDASVMTAAEASPEHAGLDGGGENDEKAGGGDDGSGGEKHSGPSEKEKLAQRLRDAGFDTGDGEEPAKQTIKAPETVEGEIPEDSVGIPEDFSERQRRAFIQERINNRKKVADLEKQLSRKEAPALRSDDPALRRDANPADGRERETPKTGADVAFLFSQRDKAQKVLDGFPVEGMSEGRAKQVLSAADLLINGLDNMDAALDAIEEASAKGDRDLMTQIRDELPIIRMREMRAQKHLARETQEHESRRAEFDKEIGAAMDSYPELKEKNPDAMKFANEWMKENVGKPENQGPYYVAFYGNPRAASRVIHSMMDSYKANRTQAYQDEIKLLRAKINSGAGPMDGGGAPPVGGGPLSEKQKTARELQRRGIILE